VRLDTLCGDWLASSALKPLSTGGYTYGLALAAPSCGIGQRQIGLAGSAARCQVLGGQSWRIARIDMFRPQRRCFRAAARAGPSLSAGENTLLGRAAVRKSTPGSGARERAAIEGDAVFMFSVGLSGFVERQFQGVAFQNVSVETKHPGRGVELMDTLVYCTTRPPPAACESGSRPGAGRSSHCTPHRRRWPVPPLGRSSTKPVRLLHDVITGPLG